MPGLINPASTSSVGAVAGMKRAFAAEEAPTYGEPYSKKQKVVHKLHHTQPVQHIVEPINAELDPTGENKDFFDQQLLRAIAIQCRSVGFDGARPEVLEEFRSLVDSYMTKFLSQVRKSMSSSRRTETVPHDWVYALSASGLASSSSLEGHLDIGQIPPSMLQPRFEPPIPPQAPPPDVEGLLGAELSGRVDKENRPYIPKHFPPFPSKHTYKATPVFTQRENDPRKIREKATEEGILAEQSLRKLMAAQKQGIQRQKAGKRKRSKRMKESDRLWQESMKDLFDEEAQREAEEKKRLAGQDEEDDDEEDDVAARLRQQVAATSSNRRLNLEEGVHVNYERKFYRKSARGV